MGLKNFWEYVIENGWQVAPLPEDDDGNYICPFCNSIIKRNVGMDSIPIYERIIHCPKCGEIELEELEN